MLHGERYDARTRLALLRSLIIALEDKRDEQECRVYREVGCEAQCEHCVHAVSTDGIGYRVQNSRGGKDTSRSAQTGYNSERVEQEPLPAS